MVSFQAFVINEPKQSRALEFLSAWH